MNDSINSPRIDTNCNKSHSCCVCSTWPYLVTHWMGLAQSLHPKWLYHPIIMGPSTVNLLFYLAYSPRVNAFIYLCIVYNMISMGDNRKKFFPETPHRQTIEDTPTIKPILLFKSGVQGNLSKKKFVKSDYKNLKEFCYLLSTLILSFI